MTLSPQDLALQLALEQDLAGIDDAEVYGSSRNFEPSSGRVKWKAVELTSGTTKLFIVTCEYVWFRGGMRLLDPHDVSKMERVDDNTFQPGDEVGFKVNLHWKKGSAYPHIKAWTLAIMQRKAQLTGRDPRAITAAMITKKTTATLLRDFSGYEGIECDYKAEQSPNKDKTKMFTKVTWLPFDQRQAPAVRVAPAPRSAPALPVAAPAAATPSAQPTAAAAPDALAGLLAEAPAEPDALAGLLADDTAPPPTRDVKISVLRRHSPKLASKDFTKVTDETIDAAYAQVMAVDDDLPY